MKFKLKLKRDQKIIITCFLFALLISVQTRAQQARIECRSDDSMRAYYNQNPDSKKERSSLLKKLKQAQKSGKFANKAEPYVIPVVFHVFGTVYNSGKTVNLQIVEGALKEMNENMRGLNASFNTIDAPFNTIKETLNVQFKLAKKDPNGNTTTGVVFYNQEGGMGNAGNTRVPQVAWDNYKYCNIYITRDLYNNGITNNTGVAWYPSTGMSNAGTARIVYNGSYLGTNKTSTQGSTLTHEMGHWLDLPHTFDKGICNNNPNDGDGVADTPSHRNHSGSANCQVIRNCLNQEINVENYMDYTSCEKMFTKGQVARMTNALDNSGARNTLWTEANLIATGINTGTTNPTCTDGIKNGNETGMDCGGDCPPCDNSTYCDAGRQGSNYIAGVTFGSISNTSQNGSYSNFTAQSTNVNKGASITLTVTPGIVSSNWNSNIVGGWIDWNQDGDFNDPGEQVLMKPRGVGAGSATVLVPNNATDGATRLRVRYRWYSNPNPCGIAATDGDEVEDYTVNVGGVINPDPTCTDGLQNGDETGTDCGGTSCPPCQTNVTYCSATGNAGPEAISNVSFAGINNSSVRNSSGYDNFTTISGNVSAGTSYNLQVNIIGYNGGSTDELYAFFDWNQDGDFADPSEKLTLTKTSNLVGAISVTVPASAKAGSTRMRLLVSYYDAENNPCNTGTNDTRYGEYEDYTINVTTSKSINTGQREFVSIATNPIRQSNRSLDLNFSDLKPEKVTISVYNTSGRRVASFNREKGSNRSLSLELNGIKTGMYFARVTTDSTSTTIGFMIE